MKTYEEMARDVLKRRDEELLKINHPADEAPPEIVYPAISKKRGWLPKIAIPCAAAVLVGTVGVTVWKNNHKRSTYINHHVAELSPQDDRTSHGNGETHMTIAPEVREDIYKGGKTEININEAEEWNVYNLPALLEEDFRGIDDDKINNYYGMEFDRLSRLFPDWKSEHEPFGVYEHDENDGFIVSHGLIYNTNCISYTTEDGGSVTAAASLRRYDSASVEDAKASVVNGFDAMIYKIPSGEYAADIEMDIARVTIKTVDVDESMFLNILDVYTAPDKNVDNNHNQTMEDKIVVLDEAPDFVNTDNWPFKIKSDENLLEGSELIRYSMNELNDFYGINFGCLSELHPDWLKMYTERSLGIYVHDYDGVTTENMAASGGRAIVWTKNTLGYQTTEGAPISISAMVSTLSDEDIGSSLVNGYNAVIFRKYGNYEEVWGHGAAIQMNGTLVFITTENQSEDAFIDLVREYTNEASKYNKHSNTMPEPKEETTFNAVDIVDSRIAYEVNWSVASYWLKNIYNKALDAASLYGKTEGNEASLGYLREFFGTDKLPVDEQYKNDFKRDMYNGYFSCHTSEGANAYSPVNGKVVGACYGWYNSGLGNSVAVEFDDGKYFIIGHLDEVNVEVGDTVTAGQILGVCGRSGKVFVDDPPLLTLIAFTKTED